MKKRLFFCFGTRPEAIKLAPVVKELIKRDQFETKVCVTAQHRQMLDQVLKLFEIKPDYDLNLMSPNQSLEHLTGIIIEKVAEVLAKEKPNCVIVQGDTTTTFATALAAFYQHIPVAHVEAGLRTYNIYSPFPEEMNRRLTSSLVKWHFAPTLRAEQSLLKENMPAENIYMVGNTVIDALLMIMEKMHASEEDIKKEFPVNIDGREIILVTGHRRESFGEGFQNICLALKEISEIYPDTEIIYPVHLNPNVQTPVNTILTGKKNIHLIAPQDYLTFTWLLNNCKLVLTDSGGIQEEAPALGKPVLVMRETTERPEAVEGGVAKLVGTDKDKIVTEVSRLLDDEAEYQKMANALNPFGDGKSSARIADILETSLIENSKE